MPTARQERAEQQTRHYISDKTAFDAGEEFDSPEQVREYFTAQNMIDMFGAKEAEEYELTDQSELDWMANDVIENRWHCAF